MNSDFVLIMKMKRGDEAALERFVRKYYQIILNYCNYHCFDGSYAEDLTQETFARFFEKLSDYRCMGKTLNYLYTIAGNLCRDYYKKKKESLLEDEQKIKAAIKTSMDAFYASEQKQMLSYHDFLWTQLEAVRKKWWILQFLLLLLLWTVLRNAGEDYYVQRSLGVVSALFVIMIIPELWKNQSNQCMEIESASYYSLKQVYAARILLFGVVDIFLLTLFCGAATIGLHLELTQLIIQFLFPLTVTACICFGTLCSKYLFREISAIGLCILWSVIWMFLILDESIYKQITEPIWMMFLVFAVGYLGFAIYRLIKNSNSYWEASQNGIKM